MLNEQYPWLYDNHLRLNYGTSEGVRKAWDTRGRGQKEDPTGQMRLSVMGVSLIESDPAEFLAQRDKLPPDKSVYHSIYTPEQYKEMGAKTYMSPEKDAGFALKKSGDHLEGITLFSLPGAHKGAEMIKASIAMGMDKLDCIGPFLKEKYEAYGFKVVETVKWDDQYAPDGWNYETHGRPDIYYMIRDKGQGVKTNMAETEEKVDIPAEAYKKAKRYRPDEPSSAELTPEQLANLKKDADEMFD